MVVPERPKETRRRDDLALRGLWLMNAITTEREEFNSRLRNGFIQMAQARYVMGGSTTVSALKFPATMSASYVVETESRGLLHNLSSTPDKEDLEDDEEDGKSFTYRNLVRAQDGDGDDDVGATEKNGDSPTDKVIGAGGDTSKDDSSAGLRRRNVAPSSPDGSPASSRTPPGDGDGTPEPEVEAKKSDSASKLGKFDAKRDPLKWFGVLVPSSLRGSQADFRRAVESSVRLANYQDELMAVVGEYRRLKAEGSGSKTTEE